MRSRVAPEENDAESSPDEDRRVSESLTERTGQPLPTTAATTPLENKEMHFALIRWTCLKAGSLREVFS